MATRTVRSVESSIRELERNLSILKTELESAKRLAAADEGLREEVKELNNSFSAIKNRVDELGLKFFDFYERHSVSMDNIKIVYLDDDWKM